MKFNITALRTQADTPPGYTRKSINILTAALTDLLPEKSLHDTLQSQQLGMCCGDTADTIRGVQK